MPNPKASSTGYMFLKAFVNSMGEEEAFAYFDSLYPNMLSFTSSGSGPVNALVQKEAAIGLGMTFQAVNEINKGSNLQILFLTVPLLSGRSALLHRRYGGHRGKAGTPGGQGRVRLYIRHFGTRRQAAVYAGSNL